MDKYKEIIKKIIIDKFKVGAYDEIIIDTFEYCSNGIEVTYKYISSGDIAYESLFIFNSQLNAYIYEFGR